MGQSPQGGQEVSRDDDESGSLGRNSDDGRVCVGTGPALSTSDSHDLHGRQRLPTVRKVESGGAAEASEDRGLRTHQVHECAEIDYVCGPSENIHAF